MNGFWSAWVQVWCWATLAFGALFVFGAFPATDAGAVLFYDMVYWPIDGAQSFDDILRFTVGVLGAVLIGWAITIFGMVRAAASLGAPVWRTLTVAMLAWFTIDSTISVLSGAPVNALSNAVFLGTFLVAIFASGALRAAPAR